MINDKYSKLPSRQARWAKRNPDKVKSAKERYKQSERYKKWLERTKQQRLEYAKKWRQEHPNYYKKSTNENKEMSNLRKPNSH